MDLTSGKIRGIDALATDEGVVAVLAIDHRDSLKAVLPGDPTSISAADITSFKLELIEGVGPQASGLMLEPEFSLPEAINTGALKGSQGFMAALEAQGYLQDPWAGPTKMLDGWSAADAKKMGASAAKLLLAYDPDRTEHAAAQRQVVESTAAICAELDLAFIVEPVAFGVVASDRPEIVMRSVQELSPLPIDVMKLEFPGDPNRPEGWADACAAVDAACRQPWVLLSSGVTFDAYRDQLEVAFDNGCSGFTGGRAIWRPASDASAADRAFVIGAEVFNRFAQLRELAVKRAKPWRSVA